MDEEIFQKHYYFSRDQIYWNVFSKQTGYRIYLIEPDIGIFSYSEYNKINIFDGCNLVTEMSGIKTNWLSPYSQTFKLLSKDEEIMFGCSSINNRISKQDFERIFAVIYAKADGTILEQEIVAGPCSICGLNDKWNSINNGKSYCYQHCRW